MAAEEDTVWKEVLDRYFDRFLEFFFPEIHRDVDWTRPCEFLDKELEKIVRDSAIGKRLADKLVKVFLRDGSETWILVHIEIQGYSEESFERRMFVYNYRIFDRYGRDVVSLAVLTDEEAGYRPGAYGLCRWGFELKFRFPVVKLLDYRGEWEKLERNLNPFAVVVMAHLKAQECRTDRERFAGKLRLVRMLYERGYGREDIMELFRFIDWLLVLPEDLEREVWREHKELEKEATMPYVTHIERILREQFRQEGRAEGKTEGLKQGLLEAIELGLSLRFGKEGLEIVPRVREIGDLDRLRSLKNALKEIQSAAEFDDLLGQT